MKSPKPRNRFGRPGHSAALAVGGAAALVAVGVALGRRSRSTAQPGRETGEGREAGVVGRRDDAVENPLIGHEFRLLGDRFRVLESARNRTDESLRFEYFARPRASVPKHVQPELEESFEVVSGRMGVRVGGRKLILSTGQSAVGPPGVPHEWWNLSDEEEVHMLVEVRPALHVETLLETWVGSSARRQGDPGHP